MAEVTATARACAGCSKPLPDDPLVFLGIGRWFKYRWTCGHPESVKCPDCYIKANKDQTFLACPQCGCGESYC